MDAFKLILQLLLVTLSWKNIYGEGCFPAQYWLTCLIDSCKFGGKCPGDPNAKCKMEKTDCKGCTPVWYTKAGMKANCSVKKDLNLCPHGEKVVHCLVDSCKWPCTHPDFKNAKCRQNYCGECNAEYFMKDAWVMCPTGVNIEQLPTDTVVRDNCVPVPVPCDISVCLGQTCSKVQNAVCRTNNCNGCSPAWYLDNRPVDCKTGAYLDVKRGPIVPSSGKKPVAPWQRECAKNEKLTPCGQNACHGKTCRNFPNAICRPDGCGGCKDTWFLDNKLVDCLSTECPPRVPIFKCVDDPCKYFSHYCPSATCRASQCGKCEAKFYSKGEEIDCAMPPKACPASVKPRSCPWYTCPANICPSNNRLMCQIDPCDKFCKYKFIDIYTGEARPCRVFDGDGSHKEQRDARQRVIEKKRQDRKQSLLAPKLSDIMKPIRNGGAQLKKSIDPAFTGAVPAGTPFDPAFTGAVPAGKPFDPAFTGAVPAGKPFDPAFTGAVPAGKPFDSAFTGAVPAGKPKHSFVKLNRGDPSMKQGKMGMSRIVVKSSPIKAEPILMKAGPPIQDPDLLSLLRVFPHEMRVIPSGAIQSALKIHPNFIDKKAVQTHAMSGFNKVHDDPNIKTPFGKPVQQVGIKDPVIKQRLAQKSVKLPAQIDRKGGKIVTAKETPVDVLYPELQGMVPHDATQKTLPNTGHVAKKIMHENSPPAKPGSAFKPIKPVAPKPVEPGSFGVPIQPIENVKPVRSWSRDTSERQGVPISVTLFNSWINRAW